MDFSPNERTWLPSVSFLFSLLSAKRDAESCIARKIEVPQSVMRVCLRAQCFTCGPDKLVGSLLLVCGRHGPGHIDMLFPFLRGK